jgi:hypothetical protein
MACSCQFSTLPGLPMLRPHISARLGLVCGGVCNRPNYPGTGLSLVRSKLTTALDPCHHVARNRFHWWLFTSDHNECLVLDPDTRMAVVSGISATTPATPYVF